MSHPRLKFSKTEVWDLAVQTLGLQPGSFSRLFLRESLSLENSDFLKGKSEASLGIFLRQALGFILFGF